MKLDMRTLSCEPSVNKIGLSGGGSENFGSGIGVACYYTSASVHVVAEHMTNNLFQGTLTFLLNNLKLLLNRL
jgi:hypothetical protein